MSHDAPEARASADRASYTKFLSQRDQKLLFGAVLACSAKPVWHYAQRAARCSVQLADKWIRIHRPMRQILHLHAIRFDEPPVVVFDPFVITSLRCLF